MGNRQRPSAGAACSPLGLGAHDQAARSEPLEQGPLNSQGGWGGVFGPSHPGLAPISGSYSLPVPYFVENLCTR
jgi:hypothetical protein